MKDDGAFERKRRIRDKANKRFLKQRHRLLPLIIAAAFLGATIGGRIGLLHSDFAGAIGAIIGGGLGLWIGGAKVIYS